MAMISLESDKVCNHLVVKHRMFVCKMDPENEVGMLKTAQCMMDPHAAAYIDAKYCANYAKAGETNAGSNKVETAKSA
jgi:hypothetical protein